jgi:hypothetical protein
LLSLSSLLGESCSTTSSPFRLFLAFPDLVLLRTLFFIPKKVVTPPSPMSSATLRLCALLISRVSSKDDMRLSLLV